MKISYGDSRFSKQWVNKEITFDELCGLFENTRRTTETVLEFKKMPKDRRDNIKDVGGFVLGHLREGRRRKDTVMCRSGITLDADHADRGFVDRLKTTIKYKCTLYATHSHESESPRLRQVIPLARDVLPDEYAALARLVADEIGMDFFDDTTYEPERLMYWPSTPSDGEYVFQVIDGPLLDPDVYLARLPDWRDCSSWPVSSRQPKVIERNISRQQDPAAKDGVVGAFCRCYSITDTISVFLPDVYKISAMPGRYDYIPADSSAGVVVYDDKWAYSHHATDPACGRLLNAFDLVRAHRFPDMEEKASCKAMSDLAVKDERVKLIIAEDRKSKAEKDFAEGNADWMKRLDYEPRSTILKNTLRNLMLILENDQSLRGIVFNQLSDGMEIIGDVPWKHPARFWRDADDAQLVTYIDTRYGTFSVRNYEVAVTKVADDRSYHPIREYLDSLPEWDGVLRVDMLLIYYLGAEDNMYVRAATRKMLCAAIARVFHPGIKFDTMLVLCGPQGVGKSTLISKLGGEWFSDSLSLNDTRDKTAPEKLQGYWVLEISELAGLKKTEIETLRSFLSRQNDIYRASFGRRATPHPRQCVFFGTTNAEKGYLRDTAGNRRFWPVKTPGGGSMQAWQLTADDVSQIWAEALVYYNAGEKLYLDPEVERVAKEEQREAMEADDREGLVKEYLETPLPENWPKMDLVDRISYLDGGEVLGGQNGVEKRATVSNLEVWCECFRKERTAIQREDSYELSSIMTKIGGWQMSPKRKKTKIYGVQWVWERLSSEVADGVSETLS